MRTPQPGELIGERYRLLDVVGEGGMGVVYRAQNVITTKQVALKWLRSRCASGVGSERLLREARAASRLKHPNIVDVYDLIRDSASGSWMLVMELLQGETLRQYMLRSPEVRLPDFVALLLPALGGVAAAHELGIVHRDLKPENIYLERIRATDTVVPKVLDFGVAKLDEPGALSLTATGATLGTPFYMSPEQYRGEPAIDARSDVYAVGVMLYEAITGRTPHGASSLPELALKVTSVDAPSLKKLRPNVPSSLARLVDWSLARDPEQRIPTLKQLCEELEVFSREQSFRAEMTHADATVPQLALATRSSEPLAATRVDVRMRSDTRLTGTRRPGGPKQQLAWLSLGSCALALTWIVARYDDARFGHNVESNAGTALARAEVIGPSGPSLRVHASLDPEARPTTAESEARPLLMEASHVDEVQVGDAPQGLTCAVTESAALPAPGLDADVVRPAAARPRVRSVAKTAPPPAAPGQSPASAAAISELLAF